MRRNFDVCRARLLRVDLFLLVFDCLECDILADLGWQKFEAFSQNLANCGRRVIRCV